MKSDDAQSKTVAGPQGMILSDLIGRVDIRVRYSETDRMGIAYNAHYLTWFEVGRTELMRELGLSYREVEERGVSLPLVESRTKLRIPVEYDDILTIETSIAKLRSRMIEFEYRILRGRKIVAEGSTEHASVVSDGTRGKKSANLPEWLKKKFIALPPAK